jgi:hypothetical protein
MRFLPKFSCFGGTSEAAPPTPVPSAEVETEEESTVLKTLGWISAALGAVALGLIVGREIRQRYKFNHRTPYDLYSHSGEDSEMEFGVGI